MDYKGQAWCVIAVLSFFAVTFLFTDVWGEGVWGLGVLCIVAIFVILISPRGPFGDGGD